MNELLAATPCSTRSTSTWNKKQLTKLNMKRVANSKVALESTASLSLFRLDLQIARVPSLLNLAKSGARTTKKSHTWQTAFISLSL